MRIAIAHRAIIVFFRRFIDIGTRYEREVADLFKETFGFGGSNEETQDEEYDDESDKNDKKQDNNKKKDKDDESTAQDEAETVAEKKGNFLTSLFNLGLQWENRKFGFFTNPKTPFTDDSCFSNLIQCQAEAFIAENGQMMLDAVMAEGAASSP